LLDTLAVLTPEQYQQETPTLVVRPSKEKTAVKTEPVKKTAVKTVPVSNVPVDTTTDNLIVDPSATQDIEEPMQAESIIRLKF
jgi:hypothetical protein